MTVQLSADDNRGKAVPIMIQERYTPNMRRSAGFVAVVAGVTLLARLILRMQQSDGVWEAFSFLSQYFTILTNALVFVMMTLIALGRIFPARIVTAVVVAIACVGMIYHMLLAHLVTLSGIELLADHGTHTIVPLLSVLWWLIWGEQSRLSWQDLVLWIVWPLIYCAYILIRAFFTGFYPYPFLNLPELGPAGLAFNILGLLVGFLVVGAVIIGLRRLTGGAQIHSN